MKKIDLDFKPVQVLVLGFILLILTGTLLLSLPFSSVDGKSVDFINALFTATSSVCITGLTTLSTYSQWTIFGKIVIITLVQIGGLGFMSFITGAMLLLGKRITLKERIILKESFNLNSFQGIVIFLKKIIIGTFFIESIGGILLSFVFVPKFGFFKGVAFGIYHSISAFCNAGIDIMGNNSLCNHYGNILLNFSIMFLIFCGGIGFTVWIDIYNGFKSLISKECNLKMVLMRFSLHTKLVLTISIILILGGWIILYLVEYSNFNTIGTFNTKDKLLATLFQSVSLRTAGFSSVPQGNFTDAGKMIGIILMIIGGSPGGTAGGIKTVTIGVVLIAVISVIKGRNNIVAFKRSISLYALQKSLTIVVMFVLVMLISTLLLTITESKSNFDFIDILYEVSSAIGTVGFTTGITPMLTDLGKIIIIICMFIGRLGPITIAVALASKGNNMKNPIEYPEGKILVG